MTSEAQLGIDASDFRRAADTLTSSGLKRAAGKPVAKALRDSANAVRRSVRAELKPHRRTGKMISNVRTKYRGYGVDLIAGVRMTGVGSNLIVGGVRPHSIAPGKIMPMFDGAGKGSGITGFATAVEHPGFPPDPVFARGVQKAAGAIQAAIDAAAATMAADLAGQMKGKR
jgi:hypothetical protein